MERSIDHDTLDSIANTGVKDSFGLLGAHLAQVYSIVIIIHFLFTIVLATNRVFLCILSSECIYYAFGSNGILSGLGQTDGYFSGSKSRVAKYGDLDFKRLYICFRRKIALSLGEGKSKLQ